MVRTIHITLLITLIVCAAAWITSYLGRITIERTLLSPSQFEGYDIVLSKGSMVFSHGKLSDIDYTNHIGSLSLSSGGDYTPSWFFAWQWWNPRPGVKPAWVDMPPSWSGLDFTSAFHMQRVVINPTRQRLDLHIGIHQKLSLPLWIVVVISSGALFATHFRPRLKFPRWSHGFEAVERKRGE